MILPKILPDGGHLIAYHVVTEGRCFANIIGEEPIAIEAGQVIVFTKGDAHVLSSSPGMRADPRPPGALDGLTGSQLPFVINYGSDGPTSAKFVCGYLACDARPFNPLLDNLPTVITAGDPHGSDAGWLGQFIRLATMESADKRGPARETKADLGAAPQRTRGSMRTELFVGRTRPFAYLRIAKVRALRACCNARSESYSGPESR